MHQLLLFALALLTFGCATAPPTVVTSVAQSTVTLSDTSCVYIPYHFKSDGSLVEGAYNCPSESSRSSYAVNMCSWVDGYYRKDGVYVLGYNRCKYNRSHSLTHQDGSAKSTAPCVTGYCGPVNVKGYYRKDGTYVRPHTRSKRK